MGKSSIGNDTVAADNNNLTSQDIDNDGGVLTAVRFESDLLEAEHRAAAVRKHYTRAANQLMQGALIIAWIAITPFLRGSITTGINTLNPDELALKSLVAVLSAAAVPIVLGFWYFRMRWYRFRMYLEWREQGARADAREPETCSQGYMEMFRLYARTKRRATFTFLIGSAAIYSAGFGIVLVASSDITGLGLGIILSGAFLEIVAGILIIHVAFDISRKFVPGKILVTKTLIMSFLATTSQTDYTDARQQSVALQKSMRERKPWWFYSYRERPANDY
jgi:hypothetical protein